MNAKVRTGLSALVFAISCVSTFLLLNRCGSSDSDTESTEYQISYAGSFDAPPSSGMGLLDQSVNFTLSWNEADGKLSGVYQDDHFATSPAPMDGSVTDGVRTFTIVLPVPIDGVSLFVVTADKGAGEVNETLNISSLVAQGPGASVIFERNGIVITALKTGTGGGGGGGGGASGDAGAFFAAVAKEYEFNAKNTNGKGNGETWTHGKKYKVTIDADGTVTIATDGEPKSGKFGSNPADKYDKYDHEEFAGIQLDDKTRIMVQNQFDPKNFFVNYEITDGAFWSFSEADAGELPSVLSNVGAGAAIGTFKGKISNTGGDAATDFKKGDAIEITVDGDGNVKGTFGEFKYVENETYILSGTVTDAKGKRDTLSVTWFSPNKTTYPQWSMKLDFENGKFKASLKEYLKQQQGNTGRKYYYMLP